jgi:hypothetical protein
MIVTREGGSSASSAAAFQAIRPFFPPRFIAVAPSDPFFHSAQVHADSLASGGRFVKHFAGKGYARRLGGAV